MTARDLLLHEWTWRPAVAAAIGAAIVAHAAFFRFRRPARTAALAGSAALIVVALFSPVDVLARGTLFSAHMLQHLLLVLGAPPLALLSLAPTKARAEGDPRAGARPAAVASWSMGVGAMWLWHMPALCNAAATSDAVRAVQSVSLLAMGAAFWWPILGPRPGDRLPDAAAIAYLFTACLACSILGIAITFAPVPVCSAYVHPADPAGALPLVRGRWGLTPGLDQQLGGLLMWVPGCIVYASSILGVLGRWLGRSPAAVQEAR